MIATGGVLALLIVVGLVAGSQSGELSTPPTATDELAPELVASLRSGADTTIATGSLMLTPGGGSDEGRVDTPTTFAAVEDLALHMPVAHPQETVFLEADNAAALALVPVGELIRNDNPEGFAQGEAFDGPPHRIAAPLTSARPATGMVAVLTAPGLPVTAPVQGTVTAVEQETDAAGRTAWRVALQPANRPDLQVVVRHLDAPAVSVGQSVTVGSTQLGTVMAGAVVDAVDNPQALPAVLLHVRAATVEETAMSALLSAASSGDVAATTGDLAATTRD
jgi:hypothetical protein